MQLRHSNALIAFMRWWLLTKFTCLLTLCTLSRQTHLAVAGKQTSSVNDVIHYECMIDKTPHVRKISGIFPEKFRKVSDILFFRKTYNPNADQYGAQSAACGVVVSKTRFMHGKSWQGVSWIFLHPSLPHLWLVGYTSRYPQLIWRRRTWTLHMT